MSERYKVKVGVMVILERDNTILLTRRINTGWEDGKYSVPSGHLEPDESPLITAVRETKEEIDVDLAKEDLMLVHVEFFEDNYIHIYYKVNKWKGEPKIMETEKCDELLWADYNNLPDNIAGHGVRTLKAIGNGTLYSEYEKPT